MLDSPDYNLELSFLDLNQILQLCLLDAYSRFEKKEILSEIKLPKKPIIVLGNAMALERMIQNLLSNSLKYAKKNFSVSLSQEENQWILRFSNDSPPFSKEEEEALFQRFYRLDKARTDGSAGLGLYIVKSLVEKMQGEISAAYANGSLCMTLKFKD